MDTGNAGERPSFLRNLWYASVGAAVLTAEQAGRVAGLLVRKGREYEPSVREHTRRMADDLDDAITELRAQLVTVSEKVSRTFSRQQEIDELKRRIDELTAQLEELRRGSAAPPPA